MTLTSESSLDAPISRALGRHRVLAKLGRGGMADVYLTVLEGQHAVNKLLVAKVLREELAADEQYRTMFIEEARIAAQLNHKNVVQTFEVGESAGQHFIMMEYLDGQPLHLVLSRVGREQMPLGLHVRILALTLAGLHAAHELKDFAGNPRSLVHRDVSPQNVFVTYDGEVKVVDFGIAKVSGGASFTETGVLKGKLGYMAPEQALSQAVDRRTDLFAVGIMLWEAITRARFVNRDDGEAATLRKRINGEIPSPRLTAPDAPDALAAICERAIAYEASDRFASAAEFEDALEGYLESSRERTGAKELGALVSSLFAVERENVRAIIEERLSSPDREVSSLPTIESAAGGAFSHSRATQVLPARPRRRWWIAAGVLATTTLAAAFGFMARRSSAPPAPAPTALAVPTAPTAPGPTVPTPPVIAQSPSVRLRLSVTPPAGRLELDGKALPENPFAGDLPRDSALHHLSATAEGYVAETREVRLDRDLDVEMTLARKSVSPPPAARPKRPPSASKPAEGNPSRSVDDKDPYSP